MLAGLERYRPGMEAQLAGLRAALADGMPRCGWKVASGSMASRGRGRGRTPRGAHMRFAIAMTDVEGVWDGLPEARQREVLAQHEEFRRSLEAAGRFVDVLHFHPRSEAKTVRMDAAGRLSVVDGPFSDAPEYVGGIYVIEADSLDEAVDWAKKARFLPGANEVRQVHA